MVWLICTVALFLKILIGRCSDGGRSRLLAAANARPRKSSVSLARPTLAGAKPSTGQLERGALGAAVWLLAQHSAPPLSRRWGYQTS